MAAPDDGRWVTFPPDEPTFAGELHGVRTWRLRSDADDHRVLGAIGLEAVWPRTRSPLRAQCAGTPSIPAHVVPARDARAGSTRSTPHVRRLQPRRGLLPSPRRRDRWRDRGLGQGRAPLDRLSRGVGAGGAPLRHPQHDGQGEALAEAYGASARLVPSRSALRRELAALNSLAPATVASLLVDERILVLTPARGDRLSNGFELAEIDVDEDEYSVLVGLQPWHVAERCASWRGELTLFRTERSTWHATFA